MRPGKRKIFAVYSCKTTVSSDLLILILPLYSMKPSFLNLFMKKFTRGADHLREGLLRNFRQDAIRLFLFSITREEQKRARQALFA